MAKVIVEVMPKPEILDPQGKAITKALERLGYEGLLVRQGKRFVIDVDGEVTDERLDEIIEVAGRVLANTVIEDFEVYAECWTSDDDQVDDDSDDSDNDEDTDTADGDADAEDDDDDEVTEDEDLTEDVTEDESDDEGAVEVSRVIVVDTEFGEVSPTEVTIEIPIVRGDEEQDRD